MNNLAFLLPKHINIQTLDFDEEEIRFYDSQPEGIFYKTIFQQLRYL